VTQLEQLKRLGSVRVFSLAKQTEPRVTLNLLWALEGAILGQPWQSVAREHRASLILALEDHERHGGTE
jgi:DNA transformation protein